MNLYDSFHGFPRSPPRVTPYWHTLPFLFWGSKFPLPSRGREGEEGSIAAAAFLLIFFLFHSSLWWHGWAGPPRFGSLPIHSTRHGLANNTPGKRKCGWHAALQCQSQWRSVIIQGCSLMGHEGWHSSAWVQCPGIWVAIEIVHIASLWVTSKCWPQPHTKAHLGAHGPDPSGREPMLSHQSLLSWAKSYRARPPCFSLLPWPKHHIEQSGWTRAPQANVSMIHFNFNTSLLRWVISF